MKPVDVELQEQKLPLTNISPTDDVDFTSGYEQQYREEYAPLKKIKVPPPDPEFAWYRDFYSVAMLIFLIGVFFIGTAMLFSIFRTSLWQLVVMTICYVALSVAMIFLEISSKYVL